MFQCVLNDCDRQQTIPSRVENRSQVLILVIIFFLYLYEYFIFAIANTILKY